MTIYIRAIQGMSGEYETVQINSKEIVDYDFIGAISNLPSIQAKKVTSGNQYRHYEILINNQPIIIKLNLHNKENEIKALQVLANIFKIDESRYMISSISKILNGIVIDTNCAINALYKASKFDPDAVVSSVRCLYGFDDVSEYTAMSKEIIKQISNTGFIANISVGGANFEFSQFEITISSFYDRYTRTVPSQFTASMLNPITAGLDIFDSFDEFIDKARFINLANA